MRKIEQQMNDAVANNKNWQSANTSVHFNEENGVSIVRLHGNKIAEIGDDYLQIFDGGWQTNTTKSRLNALIDRFCNAVTDGVFQKDYQWYVRDNKVTKDFTNGYIFAWCNHRGVSYTFPSIITSLFLTFMELTKNDLRDILHCLAVTANTKYRTKVSQTELMELHERITNLIGSNHYNRKYYTLN